jgi:hypothetical protein
MKRFLIDIDDDGKITGYQVGSDVVRLADAPPAETDHERRVRERHENLTREQEGREAQTFIGSSGLNAATDLAPADLVYLRHAREHAQFRLAAAGKYRNQDVYRVLLSGTNGDINRAINGMDRADVQGELSAFNANPNAWVTAYGNDRLKLAFHEWLAKELA